MLIRGGIERSRASALHSYFLLFPPLCVRGNLIKSADFSKGQPLEPTQLIKWVTLLLFVPLSSFEWLSTIAPRPLTWFKFFKSQIWPLPCNYSPTSGGKSFFMFYLLQSLGSAARFEMFWLSNKWCWCVRSMVLRESLKCQCVSVDVSYKMVAVQSVMRLISKNHNLMKCCIL